MPFLEGNRWGKENLKRSFYRYKGCCGSFACMMMDMSTPVAVFSLIISASDWQKQNSFEKRNVEQRDGGMESKGWERRPLEKGSSLTVIIESILWKNVHMIFFWDWKVRLSLRCELWSVDGMEEWRVLCSKSPRWQHKPGLSPSVNVFLCSELDLQIFRRMLFCLRLCL